MQPETGGKPPMTGASGAKIPGFPRWEQVVAADPKYPLPEDLRRAARSNLESVTVWRFHPWIHPRARTWIDLVPGFRLGLAAFAAYFVADQTFTMLYGKKDHSHHGGDHGH